MEAAHIPKSIGIIMDGNRRWAREHNLPTFEGHKLGYEKTKDLARWCRDAGIRYVIIYGFSNENWNRSEEEIAYLREMFNSILFTQAEELRKENGALKFIGDIERFGDEFLNEAKRLEVTNPTDPTLTIVIALSYGGRQEIIRAANQLLAEKKESTSEEEFAERLYTRGIPDPDLIVRPGGEKRLSNFLPWQSTYSELFFSEKFWPEFEEADFKAILEEYSARERRHGR